MNKDLLCRIAVTVIICLVLNLAITSGIYAVSMFPLWGPYITGTTGNSTTINWKTEKVTGGVVEYATENYFMEHGSYSHKVGDETERVHHVLITDLIPNTTYHYRVTIDGEPLDDHTFMTLGTEPFTFVVYGDTQGLAGVFTQMERHKLVADRIAEEENVSFVVHTGDLVAFGDNLEYWDDFFNAGREMLSDTTIFPVLGNHECNHANYYEAFGVPEWYSFDCGDAHFTMLDSNDWADMPAETEWLKEDLESDASWKFVSFHHPPYSSDASHWGGWLNIREYWEDIFIENGVTAVFNGHVHVYERYLENGIHYVVLGCGGAPCYFLAEEKYQGYQNSFEDTLGYARITVDEKQVVMDVIMVADVSDGIPYLYPPNTVFETVILGGAPPPANDMVGATANVVMPMVGISLDRDAIDYGEVMPGHSSAEEVVTITNTVACDVSVTLEIETETLVARDFYERSLYIDDGTYDMSTVIAEIPVAQSEAVATQLRVPSNWTEAGTHEATFIFWAEAH